MSGTKQEAGKSKPTRAGLLTNKRGTPLSTGRLQSFRSPRDLTLGGSTKRTYAPSIPVRRIKEEPKDVSTESKPKKEGSDTRSRGRGRGRGKDRGRGRGQGQGQYDIIQSSSIFSEGPGAKPKTGSSYRMPSYDAGASPNVGGGCFGESSKDTSLKSEKSFDAGKNPDKILKMVDECGGMDIDEDKLETGLLPIQLPLAYHDRIKEEEKVTPLAQSEPMETDEKKPFVKPANMPEQNKTSDEQEMTCERLFTPGDMKNKEQLLFFQFPDSLPTKVFEDNTQPDKKSLRLQDISEGYVGKLQIHKSGRTRLILGGIALDVSMGTPCNFLQDLVSIHTEEDNKSILNLGHVKQRLICTPDFEELLKGGKIS